MKTFPTIDQLVERAVKGGHNAKDAKDTIVKSYEYLKSTYPTRTAKDLVHIAYVLY